MFANLTSLNNGAHADCCIVGAGPAGITIARKLARAGKKVFLFEGGSEDISAKSQDIYKGDVLDDTYLPLDVVRLRFLGGTSNHWAGYCQPFIEHSFKGTKKFPHASWPIKKKNLDPFSDETQEILDVKLKNDKRFLFDDPKSNLLLHKTEISSPTNFKNKYYDELKNNKNLFVFLNSNLIDLSTNGEKIIAAQFQNYHTESRNIIADKFVLATGGIENNRILLHGNKRNKGLLVKNPRTLGRYFMEHPLDRRMAVVAMFKKEKNIAQPNKLYYPTEKLKKKYNILDFTTNLEEKPRDKYRIAFIKKLKQITSIPDIKNINFSYLFSFLEMPPRSSNKITLGENTDQFGIPRVQLALKITEEEYLTKALFCKFLAQYMIDNQIGRVKVSNRIWNAMPEEGSWGFHHMGGTRMAETSEWGIVDKNCRVFGQKNLYIAGSSVFASGGCVAPTFTIIQLALRLAEQLQRPAYDA